MILQIFPSGRIIERSGMDEARCAEFAEEFPTIIYMYKEIQL